MTPTVITAAVPALARLAEPAPPTAETLSPASDFALGPSANVTPMSAEQVGRTAGALRSSGRLTPDAAKRESFRNRIARKRSVHRMRGGVLRYSSSYDPHVDLSHRKLRKDVQQRGVRFAEDDVKEFLSDELVHTPSNAAARMVPERPSIASLAAAAAAGTHRGSPPPDHQAPSSEPSAEFALPSAVCSLDALADAVVEEPEEVGEPMQQGSLAARRTPSLLTPSPDSTDLRDMQSQSVESFDPSSLSAFEGLLAAPAVDFVTVPIGPVLSAEERVARRTEARSLYRFLLAIAWLRHGQGCLLRSASNAHRSALSQDGASSGGVPGSVWLLDGSGFTTKRTGRELTQRVRARLQADRAAAGKSAEDYAGDAALNIWPHSAICFGPHVLSRLPDVVEEGHLVRFSADSPIITRSSSRVGLALSGSWAGILRRPSSRANARLAGATAALPASDSDSDGVDSAHCMVLRLGDLRGVRVDRRVKSTGVGFGQAPEVHFYSTLQVAGMKRPLVLQWGNMKDANMFANCLRLLMACVAGRISHFTDVGTHGSVIHCIRPVHAVQDIVDVHFAGNHNRRVLAQRRAARRRLTPLERRLRLPVPGRAGGSRATADEHSDGSGGESSESSSGAEDSDEGDSSDSEGSTRPAASQQEVAARLRQSQQSWHSMDEADAVAGVRAGRDDYDANNISRRGSLQRGGLQLPSGRRRGRTQPEHENMLAELEEQLSTATTLSTLSVTPRAEEAADSGEWRGSRLLLTVPSADEELQDCTALTLRGVATAPPAPPSPPQLRLSVEHRGSPVQEEAPPLQCAACSPAASRPLLSPVSSTPSHPHTGSTSPGGGSDSGSGSRSSSVAASGSSGDGSGGSVHSSSTEGGVVAIRRPFLLPLPEGALYDTARREVVAGEAPEAPRPRRRLHQVAGAATRASALASELVSLLHQQVAPPEDAEQGSVAARVQRALAVKDALDAAKGEARAAAEARRSWRRLQADARRSMQRHRAAAVAKGSLAPRHRVAGRRREPAALDSASESTAPTTVSTATGRRPQPKQRVGRAVRDAGGFGAPAPLPGRKQPFRRGRDGRMVRTARPPRPAQRRTQPAAVGAVPVDDTASSLASGASGGAPAGGSRRSAVRSATWRGSTAPASTAQGGHAPGAPPPGSVDDASVTYGDGSTLLTQAAWWDVFNFRRHQRLLSAMPY